MTTLIPKYDQSSTGAINRPINKKFAETVSLGDFGVLADNLTVNTTTFQSAIDAVISANPSPQLHGLSGNVLTGPINFNGTGTVIPVNAQANGVGQYSGAGQLSFIVANGTIGATTYLMTAKQLAGCKYENFGVSGNGIAKYGIDFSWNFVGPALQGSIYRNIFVEGCSDLAINFNNCNDAWISNISVRDITAGSTAISAIASGGAFYMENILCMSGLFAIACQNASIVNSEFWGGVDLNIAGLNNIVWTGTHFYPNTVNANTIINSDSGVSGAYNAQGNEFNSCYFEDCGYVVGGKWHQGARFNSCFFNAINVNFGNNVVGDNISNSIPTFVFNNCTFANNANVPVSVPGSYNVVMNNCKLLGGAFIPQRCTSAVNIAIGETTSMLLPYGTSLIQISHQKQSDPTYRTDAVYAISIYNNDSFNATSLYSHNGSAGGMSFTITQTASNNQITLSNTSGVATILEAAILSGNPWHL